MPLKVPSWFSFGSGQQSSHQVATEPIVPSFDDIVSRFDDLNNEVERLQKETEDQKRQIKDYLAQIHANREQNQKQNRQIKDIGAKLTQEKQHVDSLQTIIANKRDIKALRQQGPVKGFKQTLQNERSANNSKTVDLEKKLKQSQQDNNALRGQVKNLTTRNEELKLDVEYLKCTASPPTVKVADVSATDDGNAPLTEVPFILVLVDGDAYKFAEMLPNPYSESHIHPAARMAQNMKTYLQKYIAANGLPPHCKLMVRVLVNATGLKTGKLFGHNQRSGKAAEAIEDFMVRFTEFAPMFEFFDAGSGKERVDSKIHELYHTFLPNPACHKIFLATARDNGFARMIEQNIHHPKARAKTCLINAGDIAVEIQRLNLETVEWPMVFARQFPPKEVVGRAAKREHQRLRDEANARQETEKLVKQLGKQGYEDLVKRRAFQALTKELMGHKTPEDIVQGLLAMDKKSASVRFGMALERQAALDAAVDNSDEPHYDGHWCAEVGVD